MTSPSPAEREFFSELTRMFMSMRDAPHGELEASIEERFREFIRSRAEPGVGGLQITFTWTLPEGADDWAIYRTDYRTIPADPPIEARMAAAGGGEAAILEFPSRPASRPAGAPYAPAQVIAFPTR